MNAAADIGPQGREAFRPLDRHPTVEAPIPQAAVKAGGVALPKGLQDQAFGPKGFHRLNCSKAWADLVK